MNSLLKGLVVCTAMGLSACSPQNESKLAEHSNGTARTIVTIGLGLVLLSVLIADDVVDEILGD